MAIINGTSAAEILNSGAAADRLNGLDGDDTLNGGGGNDTLDGGAGNDSMIGGTGNDLYFVDAAVDNVTELYAQGIDTVNATVTHTLSANVEKLVQGGAANIGGTGNTLNNTLTGNTGANNLKGLGGADTIIGGGGNDTLDGGTGNDSLIGGTGNDLYFVNAALDKVVELAAQGTDTVNATVTHTLSANVEKLVQGGGANIGGTGNTLNNTLTGNTGANNLKGLGGADTIIGGAGADSIDGGAGNDVLIWDALDAKVDGGADSDTLRVTGAAALNLTTVSDTMIVSVEVIDLAGTNTLTLNVADVLTISAPPSTLRVDGGAGDAVSAGGGWTQIGNITINSQDYAQYQYTLSAATLQVDTDIDRGGIAVAEMNLGTLDGMNGFQLTAELSGDNAGISVASAGDVNGDGHDDLLVGAHGGANGAAYVVFGAAGGFASNLALATLDGTSGFQLTGEADTDRAGRSVSSAGDVNGDGYDDLLVGAYKYGASNNGAAYVVFGAASGFASNLALSGLDGTSGFQLTGEANSDYAGASVASAGDVNGDGFDDLLVGASRYGNDNGAAYVVFGAASGFDSNLELSGLDGTSGFQLTGEANSDYAGYSVASAGDVNGDGFDDLLVGAPYYGASNNGAAYVVFGATSGFASNLALSALDGTSGFRITGEVVGNFAGRSVASAGDVNGDGYDDLLVGASGYGTYDIGAAYVVFGAASGFASNLALSGLDGTSGFQLWGEMNNDRAGLSVASAGDVNGDGYDDLLVGASFYGTYNNGAAYVVFGAASGFDSNLVLAGLDGKSGFQITGEANGDFAGRSVASAGDVNGDGFDDLLVGAHGYSNYDGAAYVVFGRDFNDVVDFLGTAGANTLTGTDAAEVFVAGRGNDTLTGGGGADVFRGGAGSDLIRVSSTSFADVDGGSGTDTLSLTGSSLTLDLTGVANSKITGIEAVALTGTGNNSLTLALGDVLDLSDSTNTLRVAGNSGDVVTSAGQGWVAGGTVNFGGVLYQSYTAGVAMLLLHPDIVAASTIN